jgi:hypothetical protein
MGHESSWSGRRIAWRAKDEAARKAQQRADELACEAWNDRMRLLGGPLQPSPSLRAAIAGGFPFLRVECNACHQNAWVDLTKVRRPGDTWIWQLEASLVCQHCRRGTRFAPRAKIEMLCRHEGEMREGRWQPRD